MKQPLACLLQLSYFYTIEIAKLDVISKLIWVSILIGNPPLVSNLFWSSVARLEQAGAVVVVTHGTVGPCYNHRNIFIFEIALCKYKLPL